MNNKKSVKILKTLTAHHIDRIACYEMGIAETEDQDLKNLFSHFVQISKRIKEDLSNEVRKSGGTPPDKVREGSKFLLAWAEVKQALEKKEYTEILTACEACEKVITDAYDNVLTDYEDDIATEEQAMMIQAQHKLLKACVKEIHDSKEELVSPK